MSETTLKMVDVSGSNCGWLRNPAPLGNWRDSYETL